MGGNYNGRAGVLIAKIGVTMAYGTDVVEEVAGQTRGTLSMSGIDPWRVVFVMKNGVTVKQ